MKIYLNKYFSCVNSLNFYLRLKIVDGNHGLREKMIEILFGI